MDHLSECDSRLPLIACLERHPALSSALLSCAGRHEVSDPTKSDAREMTEQPASTSVALGMRFDGQAAHLDLKEIVLGVQFPRRNFVGSETPHFGGGAERVSVRLDDDVGGPKELVEQSPDP